MLANFHFLFIVSLQINLKFTPATSENLRTLITVGAAPVIHLSGHGLVNGILFEGESGEGHLIMPPVLRALFEAGGSDHGIRLMFISCCHSEQTGEMFAAAGIPHVVAVDSNAMISDAIAQRFAAQFYLALITGKTVKAAFAIGQSEVEATFGLRNASVEASKFILLPQGADHNVVIFPNAELGEVNNVSPAFPPTSLAPIPEHCVWRSLEIHQVLKFLSKRRLVTIRGPPGMGKSVVATCVGHYAKERHVYPNGIYVVNCSSLASIDALWHSICCMLGCQTEDDLFQQAQDAKFLLILDSVDKFIDLEHPSSFVAFASIFFHRLSQASLLCTSCVATGGCRDVSEAMITLPALTPEESVSLLIRRSPRSISLGELRIDPSLSSPTPSRSRRHHRRTSSTSSVPLLPPTSNGNPILRQLEEHPLIDVLAGHPLFICVAAPMLSEGSLHDVYEKLHGYVNLPISPSTEGDKFLPNQSVSSEHKIKDLIRCLEGSIDQLKQRDTTAVMMLAVLGMCPGGLLENDFAYLWGPSWKSSMECCLSMCLVEKQYLQPVSVSTKESNNTGFHLYKLYNFMLIPARALVGTDIRSAYFLSLQSLFLNQLEWMMLHVDTQFRSRSYLLLGMVEQNVRSLFETQSEPLSERESSPYYMLAAVVLAIAQLYSFATLLFEHTESTVWICGLYSLFNLSFVWLFYDEICGWGRQRGLYRRKDYTPFSAFGRIIVILSTLLKTFHQRQEALQLALMGLSQLEVANDRWSEAHVHIVLSDIYRDETKWSAARDECLLALHAFRALNSLAGEAKAYYVLGELAADEGKYTDAKWNLRQAARLYSEIGDHLGVGYANLNVCLIDMQVALTGVQACSTPEDEIHDLLKDTKALLYECLKAFQRAEGVSGRAATLMALGDIYLLSSSISLPKSDGSKVAARLKAGESALDAWRMSLNLYTESSNYFACARLYRRIGDFYWSVRDSILAKDAYCDAVRMCRLLEVSGLPRDDTSAILKETLLLLKEVEVFLSYPRVMDTESSGTPWESESLNWVQTGSSNKVVLHNYRPFLDVRF
jgi:hypothetical protein